MNVCNVLGERSTSTSQPLLDIS